ncbi:hypothetical protein HDZ31DRAFT_79308 [Schizophyllum fasciatum]
MADLTGKVALITGANSPGGIGFNIAQQLSNKGAKVYIGARTAQKARAGIDALKEANPKAEALPFVADMADLKQVKAAAAQLLESANRLNILVHNAALSRPPEEHSNYDVSLNYAVKRGRSITRRKIPSTPSPTPLLRACDFFITASKLANILFTKQLQKLFDTEGIPAVALVVDPGNVCTDGSRIFLGEEMANQLPYRPLDGAATSLFAAAAPEVWAEKEQYAGAYLVPFGKIAPGSELAREDILAQKLWNLSERVVDEVLAN